MDYNTTIAITIENGSDVDEGPSQPVHAVVLEVLILSLTWLVSIPTNVLVCLVIQRSRRVQSTTNYFVVSLAISDIVLAVFCTPFICVHIISDRWVFGNVICRLVRFFQTLAPTSSIMVIVAISIDRFYTIIYPLSFKITRGTAKHLICFCWIVSFILSVPTLYFIECNYMKEAQYEENCALFIPNTNWGARVYGALLVTMTYLFPFCFVTILYSRIFCHIWTTGVRKRLFRRTMNPVSRTKVKMVKMLIFVTSSMLVLLIPHYVIQLWHAFATSTEASMKLFAFSYLLIFLTTVLKPVWYILLNSNFRRGCREVFCMTNMKCYRRNNYVITNASTIGKKNHVGVMPVATKERPFASPTVTFNRNMISDKTSWPVSTNISSTYI